MNCSECEYDFKKQVTYKVGQKFRIGYDLSHTVLLCSIDWGKVQAIIISSFVFDEAIWWSKRVDIKDQWNISISELDKILRGNIYTGPFELIEESIKSGCEWAENENGPWKTQCKNKFEFSNPYGPSGNDMKFCGYCGKNIIELQYSR